MPAGIEPERLARVTAGLERDGLLQPRGDRGPSRSVPSGPRPRAP
ncbi:MAG: hypothetical protein AVDCRST_MAG69-1432 [uncultured Solirubrobacteraceae bacterium]|uniref:Uncharacterized protein n=1 Tax=uncultured Solirubrobacteraceae bacterium TaxID=1162706 RepID=A0A6J4SD39_9ACTN|nr:MAG: hypothetical protein AVDCRST_MAG69-1432 [uncultured Solirubrobacteraceae bacterium]